MADLNALYDAIDKQLFQWLVNLKVERNELTLQVKSENLLQVCRVLKEQPEFDFQMLIDICGVDYLHYGLDSWETISSTERGFSRGRTVSEIHESNPPSARFGVIYHLLSLTHHHRVRLKVLIEDEKNLMIDSVIEIWPAANWFERETFDLFGILFHGHPDLRRLLTDYGFIGHPFRKDFPLIGNVEARYDAKLGKVIYEPVSIQPRILEPKVIRHDHRYLNEESKS